MALCFLAVVILAFFTGIAIGYIVFEFYIINRSNIKFYFVEGEEVNSFLEEIRRSKDNGARMLKYNVNDNNSHQNPVPQQTSGRNGRSLSSLLRYGYSEPIQPVVSEQNSVEQKLSTAEIEQEKLLVENQVDDIEYTESNTGIDDDFVPDDDFLKKYYYDSEEEANEQNNIGEFADIMGENLSDEEVTDEDEETVNEDVETNEDDIEDIVPDEDFDLSSLIDSGDNSFYDDNDKEFNDEVSNEIEEDQTTVPDTIKEDKNELAIKDDVEEDIKYISAEKQTENTNTSIKLPTSKSNDKIESNVSIQLGGSSTSPTKPNGIEFSSGSFVNIPLTMKEKPVEPSEPPKRKRGRPRKNK